MLEDANAFSGFSVDDLERAKQFYGETLGLSVSESPAGLELKLGGGARVFVYPKPNHEPATFTILNFPVPDIERAVDELAAAGVTFERYDGMDQDDRGIARGDGGPNIAWFKDRPGTSSPCSKSLPNQAPLAERPRSRTEQAWGCHAGLVLKTSWATRPCRSKTGIVRLVN